VGAAIIDAVFDRDLETIGEVSLSHRLSVGASGMGLGLARALAVAGRGQKGAAGKAVEAPIGGPAACLAGSCSQATLQQIANTEEVMAVLHLDPDRIITGQDEARRALSWAGERLKDGPVLIASSSTPEEVAALQFRHGRDAAGHAIEQAMADIAAGLVQSGVRRLVVAGGETSGAVVDRLGIPGFLVGAEIAAGVPVLRAVGAKEGEMLLALKSGNFGGPGFFSDALDLMR
jgi:3-dehydrotetronate 4-kinase